MDKTIVILGTLDTKGDEVWYIDQLLRNKGYKTIKIDPGILGEVPFKAEITREEVAEAAGTSLSNVVAMGDEGDAILAMATGAAAIIQGLHSRGEMDGIVALGGSMGTSVGLPVMKALPLLEPKLMVSTVAFTQIISGEAVSEDLTVMPTVADIWGLNRITRRVLENAAGAISGMVESAHAVEKPKEPLIGVTTLGLAALRYVPMVKPLLEEQGYEMAVFHTNGVGGGTFEKFVAQGQFEGVLDLSQQELMSFICGGNNGVDRLEAMSSVPTPHVVAPGGTDWFCWFGSGGVPNAYQNRIIHMHNSRVAEIKTTEEEKAKLGQVIAQKLNRAAGPAIFLFPEEGFSERDKPGGVFYDPEGRAACIAMLKKHIAPHIEVRELPMHINDPRFIQEAASALSSLINQ